MVPPSIRGKLIKPSSIKRERLLVVKSDILKVWVVLRFLPFNNERFIKLHDTMAPSADIAAVNIKLANPISCKCDDDGLSL